MTPPPSQRSFEFHRRLDGLVYVYHPCPPMNGQLAWKRADTDLWLSFVTGLGWVGTNDAGEVLSVPWAIAVEQQGLVPPQGIWVSRKGDKSYVYDFVYVD